MVGWGNVMLNPRTREHISGLNNQALIEYVTVGLDLYEPEAVEFAREELNRRNIAPELHAKLRVEVSHAVDAQMSEEIAKESRPLARWGRILAFVFGWAILSPFWLVIWFVIWLNMYLRHQYQAARDLWRFGFLGWGFSSIVIGGFAVFSGGPQGSSGWVVIALGILTLMFVFILHGLRTQRSYRSDGPALEVMPPGK